MSGPEPDTDPAGPQDRTEHGNGVLATCFGIVFFLGFLLLATNAVVLLYARSVVSAAAYDGARVLGTSAGPDGELDAGDLATGERRAQERVADLLGPDASLAVVRIDLDAGEVEVEVATEAPKLLLGGGGLGDRLVTRRATSRLELLR